MTPSIDWFALAPELVLLTAVGLCMLFAVLLPRWAEKPVAAVTTGVAYLGAFIAAAVLYAHSSDGHAVIAGAIQRDKLAGLAGMIIAAAGLLAVLVWPARE